ncbi:hypothetical protein QUF70_07525 [Desulfobacterales bacterium HSG17]|nr:hypothetical protein [Desulfobacterales bacterium HSG17]
MYHRFLTYRLHILIVIALQFLLISCATGQAGAGAGNPTAIVIDDETGKPVQGAVAIAVWAKYESTMFEGPIIEARKIEEAVSDKEGKIFIKGFWTLDPFHQSPRMTIYKPGYVCWDQKQIFTNPGSINREDFDRKQRVAGMVKYSENFSYVEHYNFIRQCTHSFYSEANKLLFRKAFKYEVPFWKKEMEIRYKNRQEIK